MSEINLGDDDGDDDNVLYVLCSLQDQIINVTLPVLTLCPLYFV